MEEKKEQLLQRVQEKQVLKAQFRNDEAQRHREQTQQVRLPTDDIAIIEGYLLRNGLIAAADRIQKKTDTLVEDDEARIQAELEALDTKRAQLSLQRRTPVSKPTTSELNASLLSSEDTSLNAGMMDLEKDVLTMLAEWKMES